jgi:hypothetical protein
MKVISDDDVRQQIPAMADDELLESVDQPTPVPIVANDLLARITPRHHVINGAFEFNSQSSWHDRSSEVGKPPVKRQTKNKG